MTAHLIEDFTFQHLQKTAASFTRPRVIQTHRHFPEMLHEGRFGNLYYLPTEVFWAVTEPHITPDTPLDRFKPTIWVRLPRHLKKRMFREQFRRFLMSPVIALVYISFRDGRWTESSSIPVGFNQVGREEERENHLAIKARPWTETVNYMRLYLHNRPSQRQD